VNKLQSLPWQLGQSQPVCNFRLDKHCLACSLQLVVAYRMHVQHTGRIEAVLQFTLSVLKAPAVAASCVSGWPCSTVRTISGHVTPSSGLAVHVRLC
jgi:hypothetical protein